MEACPTPIGWPEAVATVAICLCSIAIILGPMWLLNRRR
jgi:hypothetical protein